MPEVSFYILPTASLQERDVFACKLAEKAYRLGIYSVILTSSEDHSKILDDLLWTFRANSFIPHQIALNSSTDYRQQILITVDQTKLPESQALINLSQQIPVQWQRFNRILEIMHQDDDILAAGRVSYRQYQQAEAVLSTHKL